MNTNENIERYFKSLGPQDRPSKTHGTFVPADVIKGRSAASPIKRPAPQPPKRSKQVSSRVLPRDFKVRVDSARLKDIRNELTKLDRTKFVNAGAVMLRVFLELAMVDYLKRTAEMDPLIATLKKKNALRHGTPTMRQMCPEIVRIAKAKLTPTEAQKVEKALKHDSAAPFSISELHSFVHGTDLPSERDIFQFWNRTEPLFRLMLEDV